MEMEASGSALGTYRQAVVGLGIRTGEITCNLFHHESEGGFKIRLPSWPYFRNTTPPFITKLTFSSAPMSSSGLPVTAITSAK